MMRIAHVCFPLERVGGIRTYMDELNKAFLKLGHKVDEYYITTNKLKKPEPNKNTFNISNILGFEKFYWLDELKKTLNDYDMLLFQNPCPHLLKNYRRSDWMKVYENLDSDKIIAVIHDPYLEKYYPWFRPLAEKFNIKLLSPQTKSYEATKHIKTMNKIILLPYSKKCNVKPIKEPIIVDANNFKSIKHKDLIFNYSEFKKYKIYEFGDLSTLEARQFMKVAEENKDFNIIVKGWVDRSYILGVLKRAMFGLDFSRFKNVSCSMNYTILEYVDYYVMPVTIFPLDKRYNIKSISPDRLVYDKEIIQHNKKQLDRLNPKEIALKIIDYLKEPYEKPKSWW